MRTQGTIHLVARGTFLESIGRNNGKDDDKHGNREQDAAHSAAFGKKSHRSVFSAVKKWSRVGWYR